ncbi:MAG: carboxylating nicotinate-nucleotide diphosphorylase [Methanomicrobiaceae archaeon]|nr:carboxylating nicotinate-nucleotide diphosphorylase [Methanomicrobiaceae archaeon]
MGISEKLLFYLKEDIAGGDITCDAVIPKTEIKAHIIAKQDGIIAGLAEAEALFLHFGVEAEQKKRDSDRVRTGDILVELSGDAAAILLIERTALNIIGRMSGIATKTNRLSTIVKSKNPAANVAGTRKTSPGFREFDKKAIVLGGGDPHRYSLSDGFLIKDNHLALCPLKEAVKKAASYTAYKKIEVEAESVSDALAAAESGADIIMLDNMPPEKIAAAIEALEKSDLRKNIIIEVSGMITEENILSYVLPGVDRISIGALTHSVKNFDVSLDVKPALKTVRINI